MEKEPVKFRQQGNNALFQNAQRKGQLLAGHLSRSVEFEQQAGLASKKILPKVKLCHPIAAHDAATCLTPGSFQDLCSIITICPTPCSRRCLAAGCCQARAVLMTPTHQAFRCHAGPAKCSMIHVAMPGEQDASSCSLAFSNAIHCCPLG